jgi:DNA-binding NarL/FixJ family response regulator
VEQFQLSAKQANAVIRVAYRLHSDLQAWAAHVHEVLGPLIDRGQGSFVALVRLPESGARIEFASGRGGVNPLHIGVARLATVLAPNRMREVFFNGRVVGSNSRVHSHEDHARMQRAARAPDALGFCISDSVDLGLMVAAPSPSTVDTPETPVPLVAHLGRHVSTALRLQRIVESRAFEDRAVEAVFDEKGTVQRAVGMARESNALESLRQAAKQHAAAARWDDTKAESSAWDAVISGRWSLVDRFDSDGKRFVLAYRNPSGVLDPRRLTPGEEACAQLAALGRSNKEIGSELGVNESTASTQVASALKKLGLGSRTLLPLFWRDLQGQTWAVDERDARLIACASDEQPAAALRGLTPAEREVARGLMSGLSDAEIASKRGRSRRTVTRQTETIYRKLGAHSRAEAVCRLNDAARRETATVARQPEAEG